MRKMVRSTPSRSQRRPEVIAWLRTQSGRERALRRLEISTSSITGMSGNPPTAAKASRLTKIAWSPVAIPLQRERRFMSAETAASSGWLPAMVTSKRPHARPVAASPSARRRAAPSGRAVSACRKSSTSPRATAAPAFICRARPRGASSTRSASGRAASAVPSSLPPSTTTISASPRSRCSRARAGAIAPASFSVGMMIERKTALPAQVVECPIVIEEGELGLLRADRGAILGLVGELVGVSRERLFHGAVALVALLEVLAVPVEDLRYLELAGRRVVAVAAAVAHEAAHGILELRLEPLGNESLVAKHGTPDRGAHHGDVHPGIVVHAVLPQHFVLYVVEVGRLPEEREELVLPRIPEDIAEVADRLDAGIAHEDLLDGVGVVGVDEERLLLRLSPRVEFRLLYRRVLVEHLLEGRTVLREARVDDARRVAVLDVGHVLLEKLVPGLV